MRYQSGFQWSPSLNYTKDIYAHGGGVSTLRFHGSNTFGLSVISPSQNFSGPIGWQSVMGSSISDGSWHCYESHLKNGSGGVAEVWIDGLLVHSNAIADWGSTAGWDGFSVGDNQATPSNGGDRYTDYDDLRC